VALNTITMTCNCCLSTSFITFGQSEISLNIHPPSSTRLYWKSFPPFKSHSCHGFLKFIDVHFDGLYSNYSDHVNMCRIYDILIINFLWK
jgi:hypothetical protein